MVHTCVCHSRAFRSIKGLKQHLSYVDKKLQTQSIACNEILTDSNDNEILKTPNDKRSTEVDVSESCEWIKNTYFDDSHQEVIENDEIQNYEGHSDFEFESYVRHHLESLTNFTKSLYERMENYEHSSSEIITEDLVSTLLEEIKHLRRENESLRSENKTAINSNNGDWTTVTRGKFPQGPIKQTSLNHIQTSNRYSSLAYHGREQPCTESCCIVDSNVHQNESQTTSSSSHTYSNFKNHKRPSVIIEQSPEKSTAQPWKDTHQRAVPGNATYSNMSKSGRKTMLCGDSIVKRILGGTINRGLHKGKAFVRPYVGATCDEVHYHAKADLKKTGDVDALILSMGQNNVSSFKRDETGKAIVETAEEIVDQMIKVTLELQDEYDINDVFLCTLTPRRENHLQNKVRDINSILRSKCKDKNINIIEQDKNILVDHLADKVHLGATGLDIFTNNIIDSLNNYF